VRFWITPVPHRRQVLCTITSTSGVVFSRERTKITVPLKKPTLHLSGPGASLCGEWPDQRSFLGACPWFAISTPYPVRSRLCQAISWEAWTHSHHTAALGGRPWRLPFLLLGTHQPVSKYRCISAGEACKSNVVNGKVRHNKPRYLIKSVVNRYAIVRQGTQTHCRM
jgi:hypothetical protein